MRTTSVLTLVFAALALSATSGCAVGRMHESSMMQTTATRYPTLVITKDAPAAVAVNETK